MRLLVILIILAVLLSTGCAPQLREAQARMEQAQQVLTAMELREADATAALARASQLAQATGSESAQQAVAIAQQALETAISLRGDAAEGLRIAQGAVSAAESVAAGRVGIGQAVMGIVIALLTGGGAAIMQAAKARQWLQVARHVAEVGQAFKHTAEINEVDVSDIIKLASHDQKMLGIKGKVEQVLYE